MKTILVYLACSIFLQNDCQGNIRCAENETRALTQSLEASLKCVNQNDTLLNNIQQKVMDAFVQAKISQSDQSLITLEQALLKNNNTKNNIIIYWYSYTCYYHSIFCMTEKDNKNSEKILDAGIEQLSNVTHKNSEHHALLALMESLSVQYASEIEVPSISKMVKQNAEKALQLDSLNLRAYYVLGSNDYYTPAQYGGGIKAEGYLLKAIQLSDQTIPSPYLPSWGKNSAYEMLINLYIGHKQFTEANKYYQEAITLFPDDYMINKLAGKLVNH